MVPYVYLWEYIGWGWGNNGAMKMNMCIGFVRVYGVLLISYTVLLGRMTP